LAGSAVRHALVLLNARAGTLIDIGTQRISGQIESTLRPHCESLELRLLSPREMPRAIADAAVGPHDTVIVGGGDGSASAAAAAFAGSKVLGVLPFGTMNLLARDLGLPTDPQEAVAALAHVVPRHIDLAEINGRPFHTLSGLGFFSHMARAREETRGHPLGRLVGVVIAWLRALRRTAPFQIDVVIDGKRERVTALAALVTNNLFAPDWRRPRLDEGTLELHLVEDQGTLTKLKAGAALLTGTWREDPGIRSVAAREIVVASTRRHSHASTDGELVRERLPLRYRARPGALTVLGVGRQEGR
jgi:diacylglycerol kinase family enzyme